MASDPGALGPNSFGSIETAASPLTAIARATLLAILEIQSGGESDFLVDIDRAWDRPPLIPRS